MSDVRTSATSSRTSAASTTAHPALAWAVLATAVLQVVAPVVTIAGPGSSPGEGAGAELLITPVGWAFSIWGVIYTLAIAQGVAGVLGRSGPVPTRFQVDQVVLHLGGTVWILVAALDSSTLTFLALAVMFGAVVDGVLTLARTRGQDLRPRWFHLLTRAAFGLYAGWVSAAFFLNLSTAVVGWGWAGADEVTWQLVVLAVATAVLVGLLLVGRLLTYALAGLWALAGIAVTGSQDGTTSVLVVALVAAACVAATATYAVGLTRRDGGRRLATP